MSPYLEVDTMQNEKTKLPIGRVTRPAGVFYLFLSFEISGVHWSRET
jgi:hypothetical protein